jgi:circadian clock protein KaiC
MALDPTPRNLPDERDGGGAGAHESCAPELKAAPPGSIPKVATRVPGFDLIAVGGLPANRTTLVTGTAGSGKTVFAAQFLAAGIRAGEPGVFVTFEESADDIRRNLVGFGWDVKKWEAEGRWAFVDASPEPGGGPPTVSGSYDLGALMARVEHAVRKTGAKRVSVDSLSAFLMQFQDGLQVRNEISRVASALRRLNVTSVMTAERLAEFGEISRHGIEEFVADNVIILRNVLEEEKRRRTIEILKFRGTTHQEGQFPVTVTADEGLVVLPLSAMQLAQHSSNVRVTSGNAALDEMTGGGLFRDSIVLVSGATGTGKTLITTEFLAGGAARGERSLLFAFEESREQLFRNATGWGVNFEKLEADGTLRVVCKYPELAGLEHHLIAMKKEIEAYKPNRIAVDSLSALERVAGVRAFREFVIGLTSFIKHKETAGLFTATTPTLSGGASVTEAHISTLTDSIILLRYVEMFGEMRRGLTVLKMRGSMHDKDIREFTIDGSGMHIGRPFKNVVGILTGNPQHVPPGELERLSEMFKHQ